MSLEDVWRCAAADLGLDIIAPFVLEFGPGREVAAVAVVRGFGAPKGMLLFRTFADVSHAVAEVAQQGYGFSVLEDPRPGERYDPDVIIEILRDWGWCGDPNRIPAWL